MARSRSSAYGSLLKRFRVAAGLTQEELAERALISARAISDLERGVNRSARRDTVDQVAEALQLSVEDRAQLDAAVAQGGPRVPLGDAKDREGGAGLRTFLIADVRGYTRFTQERGDEAAARLAGKMAALSREIVEAHGGQVAELRGDEVLAVFSSARGALQAAVEMQRRCREETGRDPVLPLPVGIGLDAGEPVAVEGGYRGSALNLAARLCTLARPGEVLSSDTVTNLARKVEGLTYRERGFAHLKGFADPIRVVEIVQESGPRAGDVSVADPELSQEAEQRRTPIGGFLGALPTSILVARQAELGAVMRAVDVVSGGSGQTVILVGEPGVGKTRVAQEVMLALRDRGFLVACGRCYEPHRSTPYYPFLEALTSAYADAPPEIRAAAPERWPYLGRLLPDQLSPPAATVSEGQDEQQRLFRTVTNFLIEIAGTTPVALLLDDIHWADGASLELSQHLARHTRAYPVLLLGTVRDTEVERRHPLKRALFDLGREQLVEWIKIARLGPDGTAALIGSSFSGVETTEKFATLVHRHTDGNPFYVQEVLQALVERGLVSQQNGQWAPEDVETIEIPESVRAAIEERIFRLGEGTQTVLYDASVLGQTFTFAALQFMCGLPEIELDEALSEAAHDGVLREESGDSYGFNHVLTQQALYSGLPSHRRRKLHLAAGEALERLPEPLRLRRSVELAWHFLQGGDEQRALTYSIFAGDQALTVFAHAEAEQFYRTALELAGTLEGSDKTASAERRAGILRKLGDVLHKLARYDEALRMLDEAAHLYDAAGAWQNKLGVIAQIGYVHHVRGTWPEGVARVQSVLSSLETDRDPAVPFSYEEAALYAALATLHMKEGNYDSSMAAIVRAGELAQNSGDDRIRARIEATRGDTLRLLGRPSEALRVLEDAIALSQTAGDDETLFVALDAAAEMFMLNGDLQSCKERQERALKAAERTGDQAKVAFETISLGYTCLYIGNWSEAITHFEWALRLARSAKLRLSTAHALFGLGAQKLAEGDWSVSRQYLEEGIDTCEPANNVEMLSIGYMTLAELDVLEGQAATARTRLEELLHRAGLSLPAVSSLLPVLAWCHLEMGDEDQAEKVIQRALQESTTQQNRLALLEALRVQGMLFARQRRWEEATDVIENATALARSMPLPYTVARNLRELGNINLQRRESEKARKQLQEALDTFRRLGATRDVDDLLSIMAVVD